MARSRRPLGLAVATVFAIGAAALAAASQGDGDDSTCAADSGAAGCASPWRLAAEADCAGLDPACIASLNASSSDDFVPLDEVMALVEKVGKEGLHEGAIRGQAWMERFAKSFCEGGSLIQEPFPESRAATEALRGRLAKLGGDEGSRKVVLVHSDDMDDGIGARVKKAVELVAAALDIGFFGVAMAIPPAGSLVHPREWEHGPVWCHESPADGPETQDPNQLEYPLACWRFDLQSDLFGQSAQPERRTLLWGAPPKLASLGEEKDQSPRFSCVTFKSDVKGGQAWTYLKEQGLLASSGGGRPSSSKPLRKLIASVRSFASPGFVLPWRREAGCGFGQSGDGDGGLVHMAMHFRRGDVGDSSGYAVPQQLGAQGFSAWLCDVSSTLGLAPEGRKLVLHVFTEAAGRTRKALRRAAKAGAIPGLAFDKAPGDGKGPTFHALARLEPPPPCGGAAVMPEVHVAVNNNPRDALLCMARADILVTSFSSLGWASALLNEGLVFHPDADGSKRHLQQPVHWDLRDQYMDWADNWFRISDARPAAARAPDIRAEFARGASGGRR